MVTGAAPRGEGVGNGMATAIMFAREGAKVVLVNRSAERAEKLAKQIKDEGGEASVFAGDVAKAEAAEAMAEFAVEDLRPARHPAQQCRHRRAGHARDRDPGRLGQGAGSQPHHDHAVLQVLPTPDEGGGGGSIIMVSSIAGALGLIGSPGAVAYTTAKAGLHGFTLSVAADYATENIRANCIVVGSVHTPMVAHMGAEARERRKKHGADEDRGHGVGHRPWRGLSRLRRIALGDRPDAADRRWAGGTAAVAALGRRAGGAPLQWRDLSLLRAKTRDWKSRAPSKE